MNEWAPRRFWQAAQVSAEADGYAVRLDGRLVKTPAKATLLVPTEALAQAIAAEWDAQSEKIRPETMPYTRMANSALDKVTPQRAEVAAMLADYGATDLLCYRAQSPQALIDRQALAWDPLLDWAAETWGARLKTCAGVMPVAQDPDALARLSSEVEALEPFTLAGFHDLVSISGSLIIGLAALHNAWPPETLWQASRVDEIWQAEIWGDDEEAQDHAELKRQAFLLAAEFCKRLHDG